MRYLLIALASLGSGVITAQPDPDKPGSKMRAVIDAVGDQPPGTIIKAVKGDDGKYVGKEVKGRVTLDPGELAWNYDYFTWLRVEDMQIGIGLISPRRGLLEKTNVGKIGFILSMHIETKTQKRKVQYRQWATIVAVDDLGNKYNQLNTTIPGVPVRLDGAEKPVTLFLYFERHVPDAKSIRFDLPKGNLGLKADIQLEVPTQAIADAQKNYEKNGGKDKP